jgi:hypothetical protein
VEIAADIGEFDERRQLAPFGTVKLVAPFAEFGWDPRQSHGLIDLGLRTTGEHVAAGVVAIG